MKVKFSSNLFEVIKETKEIITDYSSLRTGDLPSVIGVISARTKKTVFWCFEKKVQDTLIFQPLTPDPALAGWTVKIQMR